MSGFNAINGDDLDEIFEIVETSKNISDEFLCPQSSGTGRYRFLGNGNFEDNKTQEQTGFKNNEGFDLCQLYAKKGEIIDVQLSASSHSAYGHVQFQCLKGTELYTLEYAHAMFVYLKNGWNTWDTNYDHIILAVAQDGGDGAGEWVGHGDHYYGGEGGEAGHNSNGNTSYFNFNSACNGTVYPGGNGGNGTLQLHTGFFDQGTCSGGGGGRSKVTSALEEFNESVGGYRGPYRYRVEDHGYYYQGWSGLAEHGGIPEGQNQYGAYVSGGEGGYAGGGRWWPGGKGGAGYYGGAGGNGGMNGGRGDDDGTAAGGGGGSSFVMHGEEQPGNGPFYNANGDVHHFHIHSASETQDNELYRVWYQGQTLSKHTSLDQSYKTYDGGKKFEIGVSTNWE